MQSISLATTLLVPAILIIGYKASEKGALSSKLLVESSFFVYAAHAFPGINPIMIVNKIVRALHVDNILIVYLVNPFIVYAISVFVFYLINRYLPRVTRVIIGR